MPKPSPFRCFTTSPEILRRAGMLCVRFPLSLRNDEDLPHPRGVDVSRETVRFRRRRFGPMFAAEIRRRRVDRLRASSHRRQPVDEVLVKTNGERRYPLKRRGPPRKMATDRPSSCGAALEPLGAQRLHEARRRLNGRAEIAPPPLRRPKRATLRVRRTRSPQTFAAVHAPVANHVDQDRGVSSRHVFKAGRAVAPDEWRRLGAASGIEDPRYGDGVASV